jgi:hypothetical protein
VAALTEIASHAHTVADTLRAAFGNMQVGGFVVDMTVPQSSTNRGQQALQHICLRAPSGAAVVIGSVNIVEKEAELRTFDYVRTACEHRFKVGPAFDAEAYGRLLERATEVVENFGLKMRTADVVETAQPAEAPQKVRGSDIAWVVVSLAYMFTAGVAILTILR